MLCSLDLEGSIHDETQHLYTLFIHDHLSVRAALRWRSKETILMHTESPFTDCTDLIGDRDRLLKHAHQHGYLFFPGLLPAEPVLELRQQVLQVADQHELLAPNTDTDAAIRRKGVFICEQDGSETFRRFYIDVQKLRLFHELPHHKHIVGKFWKCYSAMLFSSIRGISATSSSPENISIPHRHIRISIRFAVHRIRGLCGHRWEIVMPSWAVWRLPVDRTVTGS